ncbi:MAG: hypothetical protein AAFY15_15940, partial [Cyanobacteria bacterium J06648_11]
MDAAIIRQGELVGRGLMAYETTEEVGSVTHLLVDVKLAEVVGLAYKAPGIIGRQQQLDWQQLVKIGGDRIIVQSEAPDAVEARLAAAQDMTALEVWTDGGDRIGHIVDICFDQSTGKVTQYLFARRTQAPAEPEEPTVALFGEEEEETNNPKSKGSNAEVNSSAEINASAETLVYVILPEAMISAGRKRMMISEEAAERSQPYAQRLTLPPKQAQTDLRADWLPEQLPEMPADLNGLLQKGQTLAGQVTEQVRQRAKQFTDEQLRDREFGRELGEAGTLPDISEQLQEKTAQVKAQLQRAKEKAQERAREQ